MGEKSDIFVTRAININLLVYAMSQCLVDRAIFLCHTSLSLSRTSEYCEKIKL